MHARGFPGQRIYTASCILYVLLIAGNLKIAKGRYFKDFGIGLWPLPYSGTFSAVSDRIAKRKQQQRAIQELKGAPGWKPF